MKTFLCVLGIVAACFTLAACSNVQTRVFPKGNNHYTIIANSSSEGDAMSGATNKAKLVCKKLHKKLIVLSHHTKYQGAFKKQTRKELNMISDVASLATGMSGPSADSNNDYITTMNFRCV